MSGASPSGRTSTRLVVMAGRAAFSALLLTACEKDVSRPVRDRPVIIVTKSEVTYKGVVVESMERPTVLLPDTPLDDSQRAMLGATLGPGYTCTPTREGVQACQAAPPSPSCAAVVASLSQAVVTFDVAYVALAAPFAPRVLASCEDDGWPDDLKRCIVDTPPRALLDHACDKLVSDDLARKVIARVAPGRGLAPADLLRH